MTALLLLLLLQWLKGRRQASTGAAGSEEGSCHGRRRRRRGRPRSSSERHQSSVRARVRPFFFFSSGRLPAAGSAVILQGWVICCIPCRRLRTVYRSPAALQYPRVGRSRGNPSLRIYIYNFFFHFFFAVWRPSGRNGATTAVNPREYIHTYYSVIYIIVQIWRGGVCRDPLENSFPRTQTI